MSQRTPTLYLYGNVQLLTLLKQGYVPLQDDLDLLQPFIDYPQWAPDIQRPVSDAELEQALRVEYQRLPAAVQALLSWPDFLQQRDRLADGLRAQIRAQRKSSEPGYPRQRLQQIGYLRLLPTATSLFGWQQLADGFAGVCLALRHDASLLQAQPGRPALLRPVQYGQIHDPAIRPDNPLPGMFCDHEEHKYRQEWRFALPVRSDSERRLKWTRSDFSALYLSVRASTDVRRQVLQTVQQDLRLRHLQLFEVVPDAQRWRLTARPLRPDPTDGINPEP